MPGTQKQVLLLLDPEDDYPTPSFEKALQILFRRFDIDKDECLSPKELQSFAESTNGANVCCYIDLHFLTRSNLLSVVR